MKPHLWLIQFIGLIVPRRLRGDWRQEWEAELRYRELLLADWDKLNWKTKFDLLRRSLGAFRDALLLQPAGLEDEMFQDLRYGVRMLAKNPGFTFVAVATLALGIGVNTAMFTVFDVLMLKPLAVKDPSSLVNFSGGDQSGGRHKLFSYLDYLDYRDRNTTLAELVAWNKAAVTLGEAQAGSDDISEGSGHIFGQLVSANYFAALGAEMTLGRGFLPEEDRTPRTRSVIVLSHHFWQRQFDGDPNIDNYLLVRAAGDAQPVMAAVRGEAEALDSRLRAVVQRTVDHLAEHLTPFRALVLIAGVLGALALLLASIGLYGVMSFVVTQRTREIGIRVALGAQGADVERLFLKEGLRLIVIGLAFGLALGAGISRLLAAALVDLNPLDPLAFGGVSIFLALVALLATYLPARRAMKMDPMAALRHQ